MPCSSDAEVLWATTEAAGVADAMIEAEQDHRAVKRIAQFINLCSAQILAEKLNIFSPFQSQLPAKT